MPESSDYVWWNGVCQQVFRIVTRMCKGLEERGRKKVRSGYAPSAIVDRELSVMSTELGYKGAMLALISIYEHQSEKEGDNSKKLKKEKKLVDPKTVRQHRLSGGWIDASARLKAVKLNCRYSAAVPENAWMHYRQPTIAPAACWLFMYRWCACVRHNERLK